MRVYLSGEIHSAWRSEIVDACLAKELPLSFMSPISNHEMSDAIGSMVLGEEASPFWRDHKSAKINAIRIRSAIEKSDIIVVKFGEKYRQWNAAFDAGYALAKGKSIIVLHVPNLTHPLKEIDAAAMAVAETPDQVVNILEYVLTKQEKIDSE